MLPFPRPQRRGLIEANAWLEDIDPDTGPFRGLSAAASLKRGAFATTDNAKGGTFRGLSAAASLKRLAIRAVYAGGS